MAFIHGRNTVVTVDGDNLSAFTTTSEFNRTQDTHDVTAYGASAKAYQGGLRDATFTMEGTYDNTASTGPRAVLEPLLDDNDGVTVVRQPEGAGTGKAQDSFTGILSSYVETSPVADMVTWSAEFQVSGVVDSTPQA